MLSPGYRAEKWEDRGKRLVGILNSIYYAVFIRFA